MSCPPSPEVAEPTEAPADSSPPLSRRRFLTIGSVGALARAVISLRRRSSANGMLVLIWPRV